MDAEQKLEPGYYWAKKNDGCSLPGKPEVVRIGERGKSLLRRIGTNEYADVEDFDVLSPRLEPPKGQ